MSSDSAADPSGKRPSILECPVSYSAEFFLWSAALEPWDEESKSGRVGRSADTMSPAQIVDAVRARLAIIVAIAASVAVVASILVSFLTPQFTSEAQLLLESRESVYTSAFGREPRGGAFDDHAVASQVQVIGSRDVVREAIRRLGLPSQAESRPLAGPTDPLARFKMMFAEMPDLLGGAAEQRDFERHYKRLTVVPVARSRVVAIRYTSEDPELAARAANAIAQVYLEQLEEAKTDLARAASTWLGTNIKELRDRVTAAEAEVESFRARSGLLVGGNNATIASQQLSHVNTELALARSAQAAAQARARLISDMIVAGRTFEIPGIANNHAIVRLLEQRVSLRAQLALEQRTLLPQHPRILELHAQLTDLDGQIAAAAERVLRILENDARIAGARVEALEAALAVQMRVVAQANESEVRLRAMEREARAERERLETYLIGYNEAVARAAQSASLPDARIVSRAVAPLQPNYPRKAPMIGLATFAAIFVSVGFIVMRELAFSRSGTATPENESAPAFPNVGSAPALSIEEGGSRESWLMRSGGRRARPAAEARL